MEVVGYVICARDGCSKLVLDGVAHRTGGFCVPCAADGAAEALKTVTVALDGGRYPIRATKPAQTARNRRKYLKRKADPGRRERERASENAKRAAMRRLRAFCPELYDLLLADERSKRGLDPIPTEIAVRPGSGVQAWETMSATAFYHALARQEHPNDGTSHPLP